MDVQLKWTVILADLNQGQWKKNKTKQQKQ